MIDYLLILLAGCCFGALATVLEAPLWASLPAGIVFGSVVGKRIGELRARIEKEKKTP